MADQPFKEEDVIRRLRLPGDAHKRVYVTRPGSTAVDIYRHDQYGHYHPQKASVYDIAELLRQMDEKDKEIKRLTDEPACVSCGDGLHNQGLQQVLAAVNVRIAELEAKLATCREAFIEYVDANGPVHERDCPGDDTCGCIWKPLNNKVNAALADQPAEGKEEGEPQ